MSFRVPILRAVATLAVATLPPSVTNAQDGVAGSTLEMYRSALDWRRKLQAEEALEWLSAPTDAVAHYRRPNGWEVVTNFGAVPAALPAGVDLSKVVLSSGDAPTASTKLIQGETSLWLTP